MHLPLPSVVLGMGGTALGPRASQRPCGAGAAIVPSDRGPRGTPPEGLSGSDPGPTLSSVVLAGPRAPQHRPSVPPALASGFPFLPSDTAYGARSLLSTQVTCHRRLGLGPGGCAPLSLSFLLCHRAREQ